MKHPYRCAHYHSLGLSRCAGSQYRHLKFNGKPLDPCLSPRFFVESIPEQDFLVPMIVAQEIVSVDPHFLLLLLTTDSANVPFSASTVHQTQPK